MKENLVENHWNQFLINPLNVIDRLYNQMSGECTIGEFHNLIKDQLADLLKSNSSRLEEIPFLNNRNTSYNQIKNKSLVRYRCMIQDMFNPEIYAAILNSQTSGKKINLYTDSVYLDEKYFINPNKNTIMDRFIYYMISIPGVNEWVKLSWDREGKIENLTNQQPSLEQQEQQLNSSHSKRSLDDELQSDEMAVEQQNSLIKKKKMNDSKEAKPHQADPQTSKKKDYCTPIKCEEELNKPVIVKVYDTKELDLKLNELVEIIGIIEFPNFENQNSIQKDNYPEISSMLNSLDLDIQDHEDYVYAEIPRVHALNLTQLTSINPFSRLNSIPNSISCKENGSTYAKLINLFEKAFFGDCLTTQYFVCWLVARVYKIQDSLPIGNFPINISNLNKIPNGEQSVFIQKFYSILASLCTHSMNLPITIHELNNRILNPFKDRENTKLQTGLLQLPTNFSLVLDETSLQPGNLKEMGIKNLSILKELINWQSIEYDHVFYTQKINSDINVLVLSEGKSLFDVSCEIKLKVN